jgi:hypothetical protein
MPTGALEEQIRPPLMPTPSLAPRDRRSGGRRNALICNIQILAHRKGRAICSVTGAASVRWMAVGR